MEINGIRLNLALVISREIFLIGRIQLLNYIKIYEFSSTRLIVPICYKRVGSSHVPH